MKNIITYSLVIFILTPQISWSCEKYLQNYPIECSIQDIYRDLRQKFAQLNINIEDIAGYKATRLIGRAHWENAIKNKIVPKNVFEPKPLTWEFWFNGIKTLSTTHQNAKSNFSETSNYISLQHFEIMNTLIISTQATNGHETPIGKLRSGQDSTNGYCESGVERTDFESTVHDIAESADVILEDWEKTTGLKLSTITQSEAFTENDESSLRLTQLKSLAKNTTKNQNYDYISLRPAIYINDNYQSVCDNFRKDVPEVYFINYAESIEVIPRLKILNSFIKANLNLYQNNKLTLAPVQLMALAQKNFVTIHPFGDGNGRTSRTLQDLLSMTFDLPFVMGSELQNDVMDTYTNYIDKTYDTMIYTNKFLKYCYNQYISQDKQISFECKTTEELNK